MTPEDTIREALIHGPPYAESDDSSALAALDALLARLAEAEKQRGEWWEKYDAEKINWHSLYKRWEAAERRESELQTVNGGLREALKEIARPQEGYYADSPGTPRYLREIARAALAADSAPRKCKHLNVSIEWRDPSGPDAPATARGQWKVCEDCGKEWATDEPASLYFADSAPRPDPPCPSCGVGEQGTWDTHFSRSLASVSVRTRTLANGDVRYDVRYRRGGRDAAIEHGGTFATLEEAEQRKALVSRQLAAGVSRIRLRDVPDAKALHWVYFVRHGEHGPIKIGTARDVGKRLRHLQIGNPVTLVLLGSVPAWGDEEAELHAAFAEHRIRGEWFRPHHDLVAYIRDACGDWEWTDEADAA